METIKDRLYNAIAGFAVGDALGVPVEFQTREYLQKHPVTDMVEYGTWNQPAGTWSDDTAMMICVFNSLEQKGRIDLDDIMIKICRWYKSDNCFDVGDTCETAILNYLDGMDALHCGLNGVQSNGNGALMRILPLAFYDFVNNVDIRNVAGLTHKHQISNKACLIYIGILQRLLSGVGIESICLNHKNDKYFYRLADIVLGKLTKDDIKSTGYVVDSLEAAIWCFTQHRTSRDFKSCVLEAVNLGGDTDTIAALTGGLCGAAGWQIPIEWLLKLKKLPIEKNI